MSDNIKSPKFRTLCVGIHEHLLSLIYSSDEIHSATIDLSRNALEARKKLSQQSYDLYFIETSYNTKEVLDLIEWIQTKTKNKHFIAIITNEKEEIKHFSPLKSQNLIDAILTKPIHLQELFQISEEIKSKFQEEATLLPKTSFDDLKNAYDQTIPEKIEKISSMIDLLQKEFSVETLYELNSTLHKIQGTAGSYGYQEVSNICKELKNAILTRLNEEEEFTPELLVQLSEFPQKLQEHFYTKPITTTQIRKPLIYIIDDDQDFLDHVEPLENSYQMEIKTSNNPSKSLNLLKKGAIEPDALFSSLSFSTSDLLGYDLLNAFPQKFKSKLLFTGLFIKNDDLDKRLHAIEQGVDLIFKKPFSAQSFLQTVEEAIQRKKNRHYKVLLLDDDIDFCRFVSVVLTKVGIEVKTIQSSKELFSSIETFDPNLLLLDIILPNNHDGFNILTTLRHDSEYQNLPVIIVTGKNRDSTEIKAFAEKTDDILFKPISIDLLQKRVLNFLERQEYKYHTIFSTKQCLNDLIKKISILSNQPLRENYLVIFTSTTQIETIQKENSKTFFTHAQMMENEVIVEYYPYDENYNALVIENTSLETAHFKVLEILERWYFNELNENQKVKAVLLPILPETSKDLLTLGEQEIDKLNVSKNEKIELTIFPQKSQTFQMKEIVIIDTDEELLKVLKMTFETYGYHVRPFQLGREALNYLEDSSLNQLVSLIITERKLEDMDGIMILKRIKKSMETPPPLIFLSYFASDNDISEGLEEGALNYIAKPFNTNLLIQKAIKAISEKVNTPYLF